MTIHEQQPKPEKMSALVREAAKLVPVDEFLQVRFQYGSFINDPVEQAHVLNGAEVIRKMAEKKGETYKLVDKIKFSIDPRVIIARQIVTHISLPEYLTARRDVLEAAIERTKQRIHLEEESFFRDETNLEEIKERLRNRLDDLNLTNKIIASSPV